ncbi:MAG: hypothetical protein B6U75_04090 [Desulfurococcales archaeon ex4484_217_1]|nr:MAG: hypothetical protein B6U75_04090 [Desulfurococcales archaeon ex4484_217_1]
MEKPIRLGIPVLDEYLGTLKPGMTILVEGLPDTYPYLLLHRIGYSVSKANVRVAYIILGDDVEDYREAAVNVGLDVGAIEREYLWEYYSIANINELWGVLSRELPRSLVIIDASSVTHIPYEDIMKIKHNVKTWNTCIILQVTPNVIREDTLLIMERLFDIVIELKVSVIGTEVRYLMLFKKHKKMPKRGLIVTYSIGVQGVRIEQLRKVPY